MKKRIFSIVIVLCMVLTFVPTTVFAAGNVSYLDENGVSQTCTSATEVTSSDTGWTTGWYVVQGTVEIGSRVTVDGDVHLILADGCKLTVNGGIKVEDPNALTIYAQSTDESTMGTLNTPNVGSYDAAIGGNNGGGSGGTITINGGFVKAEGNYGAGIGGGGGNGGSGGTITVNGGYVEATSTWGTGIGGGNGGSGGTITITGGFVEAKGNYGAGIGGGGSASGNSGDGGTITITGGTVTANSNPGLGIGGGGGSNDHSGTFQTKGGNAVIFASSIGNQNNKGNWSGIIFESNSGRVYGTTVTPSEDFTIPTGKNLTIESGKALTIPKGVTMTNEGTVENSGSIYVDGALSGTVGGKVYYRLALTNCTATGSPSLVTYDGKTYATAGTNVSLTATNIPEWQVLNGWTTSDSAVTVENNAFTMPGKALTVTARIKTIGTVSIDDPSKAYDSQPVSMDGKYTFNGTGTVTVEYKAKDAEDVTYTQIAPTDAGSYTVRISVAASDNYTAAFATQDFTITKAAQDAPKAPTVKSKTYNSVTLEQIPDNANGAKAQYSMDGGATWQDSPGFTDLTPSTAYRFVARYRETDNYFASPVSTELSVTTSAAPSSGGSTYGITVESAKNGAVTASRQTASKGATVTLTVDPDKGYTLETLTVTDKNGNEIELTNKGDGKYTFKMPGSKVTVKATFMEDNSMLNFFVDVFPGDYYYDAVLWAAENGITGGVDDTHFAPNAPCTRAQIVTFLWRAAGCPEPENLSSFADVSADSYYAKAVAWAVENGITGGTGSGMFSPDATCTRAQAMAFIYRSVQTQGGGMQGEWMFLNPFDDVNLESYYGEAVMWAVANGITNGTSDTTFSPGADCTRAQIVTFLFRCLGDE